METHSTTSGAVPPGLSRRSFFQYSTLAGLSAAGAASVLTACGSSAKSATGTQVLRLNLDADISNLDPAFDAGHTDTTVRASIFQHLVTYRPDGWGMVNELAQTFKPSSDGLSYDFTLKKGVKFHGGYGELTADDVKFSFERIAGLTKPKIDSPNSSDWATLKEVRVHDRYSGTIVLSQPFAPLMTTTIPIISGEIVSKKAVLAKGKAFATHPIGTGPYEFVSWTRNQSVVLSRFAGYSGAASYAPKPAWDQIHFTVTADENAALIALKSGALDFAVLGPETIGQVSRNPGFKPIERTTLNYSWIGINSAHPNFRDKNARLAVIHGIDVPSIISAAFNGKWTRATAVLAPGMPIGYWKGAPVYNRDVAAAKSYLSRAGAGGRKIQMAVASSVAGASTLAQIVQSNLNEVGFHVDVAVQESGVFNQATPKANAQKQLFYTGFSSKPDPSWSTKWFTSDQVGVWNWMSWSSAEYTRLNSQAIQVTDSAQRNQMYIRMQQLMDEAAIASWVAWPTAFMAARQGIRAPVRPDGTFLPWAFRAA
ncbi:MAG TPA: ABC transporter substrate-binding protein [Streptosporangiaceae bacterium]|jgi:peptide/nickel transport system substrate-binding protein